MQALQEELATLSPQKRRLLLSLLAKQGLEPARLPMVPADRSAGSFPLSLAQRRLWLLYQGEDKSLYNTSWNFLLCGPLSRVHLARSLTALVERHQTLRTTFSLIGGTARQVVTPVRAIDPPLVDLRPLPHAVREPAWRRLIREEAGRSLDLARGPILRSTLLAIGPDVHILLVTTHHIVSDGWSSGIFFGELQALYEAFTTGAAPALAPLPVQYVDFASWQEEAFKGRIAEEQAAYWREQLRGLPAQVTLPADRSRSIGAPPRGRTLRLDLGDLPAARLHELGKPAGASLFMVLLAAFATLVSRYSGALDVPVGSPVANRDRREIEPLIGFFVNTLVLRVDLSGRPTFRQLLERVRGMVLGAYSHPDLPFDRVVEELRVRREPGVHPLFQVAFMLQRPERPTGRAGDLAFTRLLVDDEAARLDLEVETWEGEQGLEGCWTYDQGRFEAATMARATAHFARLLAGVLEDPGRPAEDLPLLSGSERQALLREWNAELFETPFRPLHRRFEDWAAQAPRRQALVWSDGRGGAETWSYRALNRRANRLARLLRREGVGPDVVVGIGMPRCPLRVVAVLAVLKAGGAFLPLSPEYPAERLRYMLIDSGVRHLLTTGGALAALGELPCRVIDPAVPPGPLGKESEENLDLSVLPEQLAYVIYTSGSTGQPKGVLLAHRGLSNLGEIQRGLFRTGQGDRVLQFASFSFDASVWELAMAFAAGAALCLAEGGELEPGAALGETLAARRITHATLPPTALHLMSPGDLPGLGTVISAGEACPAETASAWAAGRRFWNAYGPTETTVCATARRCEVGEEVTIGRPLPGFSVHVLGAGQEPVPIGVAGELAIGGPALARGYHGRPALTAERFVPSPFGGGSGERLYRTGDLVRRRADGEIQFLGRIDRQVKIHGFRIELGEVEAALLGHPAVREVAVLDREDQGNRRLAAYLVLDGGEEAGPVREWARQRLLVHQVPSLWFVLRRIPVTANGKVDLKALAALTPLRSPEETEILAPRNPLEAAVAEVWGRVLDLPRVGIEEDFFDAGGDSILAIRLVGELRRQGIEVTTEQLFTHPTVAGLAAAAGSAERIEAEQGPVTGDYPPTPIQAWFLEGRRERPHHFNQAALMEIPAGWSAEGLRSALSRLVGHHDALRTRWRPGNLVQLASEEGDPLAVCDLSALTPEGRTAALVAACGALQASLDLVHGPILRAGLFRMGEGADRFLLILHHLVVDAVSWPVLLGDLLALWSDPAGHRLPRKTTSFKAWAERLAAFAGSPELAAEIPYWTAERRRLAPVLPPATAPGGTGILHLSLDEQTTEILTQGPAEDLLATAAVTAFARWSGAPRLLLELEGHGREPLFPDVDLSRTVGWFTSLYPVLLEIDGAAGPAANLGAVRAQLAAVPRRGIGHGLLRYASRDAAVRRALAEMPAPQVRLNYQGRVDRALDGSGPVLAGEPAGPLTAPGAGASHTWAIEAMVLDGRLEVDWTWDPARQDEAAARRLLAGFRQALEELAGGLPEAPSSLVAIRATGSRAPFFCLPGGGGNPLYLYPLSRHLDAERPFYAVSARGLDGRSRPHETIAEAAEAAVAALREVQLRGPYLLGGHSFGAWTAFHAAWLLRRQGEEVSGLVVFDTPAPLPENRRRRAGHEDLTDGRWLRGIALLVERVTGTPLPISLEALAELSIDSFLDRFREHLEAVHLLPPGSDPGHARGLLEVSKANTRALLDYELPGRLDVAVHLVRASELHPDDAEVMTAPADDPAWGWTRATTGPVAHRRVPGDHLTMFSPALSPALARHLKEVLDLLQAAVTPAQPFSVPRGINA